MLQMLLPIANHVVLMLIAGPGTFVIAHQAARILTKYVCSNREERLKTGKMAIPLNAQCIP